MPYKIASYCSSCQQGDEFIIGFWTAHIGVFNCYQCKKILNITLDSGVCQGCETKPEAADFYDYAHAIPYFGGQYPGEIEEGPICPKCREETLSFANHAHLNMGMLFSVEDPIWQGMEYPEKTIFFHSMIPVIQEFDLEIAEMLQYFRLDIPRQSIAQVRISFPIMLDIRTHVLALASANEGMFTVTPKLLQVVKEEYGDMFELLGGEADGEEKKWWQFWK